LLGGLVSSTNVTFTFARTSRTEPTTDRALAVGVVAANAMLYPRVLIATAILNPALYLRSVAISLRLPNPLQLKTALQMAVLFQGVLMAVYVA
jgi:uncharacterized membrane protein (DUF4010 family)